MDGWATAAIGLGTLGPAGGAPKHTLTEVSLSWTCQGARQHVPSSSTLGVTGPIGGSPLEPSTALPNGLPSLRGWALWYFLVRDMRAPLWDALEL